MAKPVDSKKRNVNEDAQQPGIVDTLANQIKTDPTKVVQQTWDNAISNLKPQSAEDYDNLVQQVQQSLGLSGQNPSAKGLSQVSANGIKAQGNSSPQSTLDNVPTQPITPPPTMGSSTPQSVQAPQPTQAPSYPNYNNKMGNPMKQSYRSRNKPFREDLDRAKSSTKGEDQEYTGMTKLEQAQAMIKDLKKKKATDANILFSLVNRLFIDVETAQKILDKEIKKDEFPDKTDAITSEPQDGIMADELLNDISIKEEWEEEDDEEGEDEDEDDNNKWTPAFSAKSNPKGKILNNWDTENKDLNEDSIYNHSHITTNNNYDYGSYDFYQVRDPYEFELNSTQLVARAMIVDQRYTYEMRFQVMKETDARFPQAWKFLLFHDIRHVLKISVNLLNANTNYMKLSPDSAPIFNETRIARIAALAFKSYIKLWGKQHFQIIIIETDNPMRLIFNALLAKELAKVSGIKVDQNLSLEMTGKPLEHTNVPGKPKLYTVLTNAAGGKIKESIEEGIFTKELQFPKKGIEINYTSFSSAEEITQKFGKLFDKTQELFDEINSIPFYHKVKRSKLFSMEGFPIDEHFSIRYSNSGTIIAYDKIIIAETPDFNNEAYYKSEFFYYDNYSTQLKEFYSIAQAVIEEIKNEKLHKEDLSLGAGEVSGLSFDEAQVDEDTESSAFMPSAPENVEGLVTNPNTPHGKKVPFGGQTGDEINADARRHLKQMSGNLGSQLEATNT